MSHAERIIDFLSRRPGLWFDDDQLAQHLGIQPRQTVSQACRQLAAAGRIRRERVDHKICNSGPAGADAGGRAEPETEGPAGPTAGAMTAAAFEQAARRAVASRFGVTVMPGQVPGVPKTFDLVSPDRTVVGDAKFYTMVRGAQLPAAKFATIAEYVWLLEKTTARHRIMVFGQDRRVPAEWLKRYGHLVRGVEFYFLTPEGDLEQLR